MHPRKSNPWTTAHAVSADGLAALPGVKTPGCLVAEQTMNPQVNPYAAPASPAPGVLPGHDPQWS
jgi:hypothetical protein